MATEDFNPNLIPDCQRLQVHGENLGNRKVFLAFPRFLPLGYQCVGDDKETNPHAESQGQQQNPGFLPADIGILSEDKEITHF